MHLLVDFMIELSLFWGALRARVPPWKFIDALWGGLHSGSERLL